MVFLDRPIYRSRRDARSKKKPGATRGLDASVALHPSIHAHPFPRAVHKACWYRVGVRYDTLCKLLPELLFWV